MKHEKGNFWRIVSLVLVCLFLLGASTQQLLLDGYLAGSPMQLPTTTDANACVIASPSATTKKALVLQGLASQTANNFEVQNSTGVTYFSIPQAATITNGTGNLIAGTSADVGSNSNSNVVLGPSSIGGGGGSTVIGQGNGKAGNVGSPIIVGQGSGTNLGANSPIILGNATGNTLTTGSGVFIGNAADAGANNATACVDIGSGAVCPIGGTVIGANAGKAGATAARFTAIGNTAGAAITAGADNVFVGDQAGKSVTSSPQNTIVGSGSAPLLVSNATGLNTVVGYGCATFLTGQQNTIISAPANTLTSGAGNIVIGIGSDVGGAGSNNAISIGNTAIAPSGGIAIGTLAGKLNATAARFTAVGNTAGGAITNGADNTFVGDSSGKAQQTGANNVAIGSATITTSTVNSQGVWIGSNAGNTDTSGAGAGIVSIGYKAGFVNTGVNNTFIGWESGGVNTSGASNTCVGEGSGFALIAVNDCTLIGRNAGSGATGASNTILGSTAGGTVLTSGANNTIIGKGADTNASGTNSAIVIGTGAGVVKASATSIIQSVAAINSATTNDLYIGSGDTGENRVAAGVLQANTGNGGTTSGWYQTGGNARNTANVTNATAVMSNLTDLSKTLTAGRKYVGRIILIAKNSTGAEGLQFDFNGGSATMTSFQAIAEEAPIGATLGTTTTSALGTPLTNTVVATTDSCYAIAITMVVNAGGTFIPRFAEVSHTTGTATVELGSYMLLEDSPN